jgi:GAF domain-containing protein
VDNSGNAGHSPPAVISARGLDDDPDLQASLDDLGALVTGGLGLPKLLEQVANFAARAIPGADGAGVTLLREVSGADNTHRIDELAASAEFVSEIDALQYSVLNEGPCITAAWERRTVRSGSLAVDKLWPRFGPRVGGMGVNSALSLPLLLPDRVVGAINVYAHAHDVFDERATRLGELFAAPAAVAVRNAQILAQALTLAAQLQTALATRPVIDQAIGILRGRSGCSTDEAFARLRTISQSEQLKLAVVARRVVDEAVRRARARHVAQ